MIDLFLINDKTKFRNVRSIPSVSLNSDHRVVFATLGLKQLKYKSKYKECSYRIEKLKDTALRQKFQEIDMERIRTGEECRTEAKWEQIKSSIKTAAEQTMGKRTSYEGKKKSTPWWTERLGEAVKNKMKKFRKWMKTRNHQDRVAYIEARRETERIKVSEKSDAWKEKGAELNRDLQGARKLLYNLASNYRKGKNEIPYIIKDKENNLLVKLEDVAERGKGYFEELLNSGEVQELRNMPYRALAQMRKSKVAGENCMLIELYEAAGIRFLVKLLKLFNIAYNTKTIPNNWQKGIICPIWKKGDKIESGNYTGITLLSHVGKLCGRIIENRLRTQVESIIGE